MQGAGDGCNYMMREGTLSTSVSSCPFMLMQAAYLGDAILEALTASPHADKLLILKERAWTVGAGTASRLLRRHQRFKHLNQGRDILLYNLPDPYQIETEVIVRNPVSQRNDLVPRNL